MNNTINQCELIDAGFVDDLFTWGRDDIEKHLDRMLVNLNWRFRFSDTEDHLPFYNSDHRPLLVKFENVNRCNIHRRPFRFEVAWQIHKDFSKVIRDSWYHSLSHFPHQLKVVQVALKDWNKNRFRDILKRKKQLRLERVNKNTFNFVINKVNQRLSSWKARTLSLVGRVTLTKFVLQALPTYVIQYCIIPKGVCDDIDKICRSFIWGEENGQRKFHSIS